MESKSASETARKPIRCKAAVCRGAGELLVIEEIEVAPPRAWEVRIKILCTSLCHTDITFWKSKDGPSSFFPRIFGHEAAGVVESVGEHVEEVKQGDLVVPVVQRNCMECRDCKSRRGNGCSKFALPSPHAMPRDGTSRFRDMNGQLLHHFLWISTFTEYNVVDISHIVKLSHELPVDKACLLSCGVTTGFGATWKAAEVEEGSTVVIFGLGTVGLAVAEGAKLRGASKIIGVDLNTQKFEIGKKFGVTDFINPASCGEKSVSQVVQEMTEGGAEYCFECVGLASLMQEAFRSSRPGCGKTIILGLDMGGSPFSFQPYEILLGKSIMGSTYGGVKPKQDIPRLAQKYLEKELNLDDYITHEVDLENINKAFDLLARGKSLRCIIWMDK